MEILNSLRTLCLLFLCLEIQLLRPVSGKYDLQVRVHRYRNPTHRRSSGYCCEPYIYSDGRCYKDCRNNILHFCLRAAGTDRDSIQCPFGFKSTTSFIGDGQQFGDTIADIDNPILFKSVQQDWSGTFQLVVDVYDYRYNTLLLIDAMFIEPSYFEVNDTFTNQYTEVGIYGRASITLSFDVYCSDNYYGHNCSLLHCTPTERYTCNANGEHVCTGNFYVPPDCLVECTPTSECDSNGNRICSREFYIPPSCTEVCVDRDDINGHYNCSSNGSRTCLDNFYGNTCTVNCEGQEGQSSCDENGTLVCEDGYYGDNCSVYCFGRDESTGHYECDIVTGDKICLEGFKNPTENCTEQVCSPPCNLARGRCVVEGSTSKCKCAEGWSGEQCLECTLSTTIENCFDICSVINPCLNGGTCTNVSTPTFRSSEKLTTNSSFVCECPEGYYNSLCESEVVILLPVDSDVTPTMDNITIAVVKSTSEPNSVSTAVAVVLVILILVISAVVLTVVIVICVRWRKKNKLQPSNDDLTVRMLDVQQSFRDGIHNACYMPQAIGVYRNHSNSTASDAHDFDNPLYQSGGRDDEYAYPVFTRSATTGIAADTLNETNSNYSGSGIYSTIDHRPQTRLLALGQTVTRDNYETVDIVDFRSGVDLQHLRGSVDSLNSGEQ